MIYSIYDKPIKVYGVPFFEEKKKLERVPEPLRKYLFEPDSNVWRRCAGGRIVFRTNAPEFTVRAELEGLCPDVAISLLACQSVRVMAGDRNEAVIAGTAMPKNHSTTFAEGVVKKKAEMEEVMLFLPRNEAVKNIEIELPDGAEIAEARPYKYGPVMFYGSSITEGGCGSTGVSNYIQLLSRWLDFDYYNFGFSSSARGELEMADYINTIEKTAFVMDYDHNAPTAEHLEKTHETFFKRIRSKNPDMPVIIMSAPNFDYLKDAELRRSIIYSTYKNAVESGDKNVYFIDGESFFGMEDREFCTVDHTHPGDLGFYRMAKVIEPALKKILEQQSL